MRAPPYSHHLQHVWIHAAHCCLYLEARPVTHDDPQRVQQRVYSSLRHPELQFLLLGLSSALISNGFVP